MREKSFRLSISKADVFCKYSGHNHTDNAAQTVARKYIQRIIQFASGPDVHSQIADNACGSTDEHALPYRDKSCRGGDGDKSDDRTNGSA